MHERPLEPIDDRDAVESLANKGKLGNVHISNISVSLTTYILLKKSRKFKYIKKV